MMVVVSRRIRVTAGVIWETVERCIRHNTSLLSAALAYYSLLSLAPAMYFIVDFAGFIIGRRAATDQVIAWADEMLGPTGARFVNGILNSTSTGKVATIAGVVTLIYGSTVAFGALQDALNLVWEVPPPERGIIKQFFLKRLISFVAVMIVGVLLLISLMASTAISAAGKFIPQALPVTEFILQLANFAVTMALVTFLFAVLYRLLPDSLVEWHDVWMGAAITALLFAIGKTLIALYLGRTGPTSPFGAAGSVVVFLLWVYYSAQIFLFGAEFTEVYAQRRRNA
jgi:membrane protein